MGISCSTPETLELSRSQRQHPTFPQHQMEPDVLSFNRQSNNLLPSNGISRLKTKNDKKSGPTCYHLFEEVPNPQQYRQSTYLKNWKELNKQPQEAQDYYAPSFIPSHDDESDKYSGSRFSSPDYIKEIPKKKDHSGILKVDDSKTMFFRGGHFPYFSDSIFVFGGFSGHFLNDKSLWIDIEDSSKTILQKVNFPEHLTSLLTNETPRKFLMQAGWFIAVNGKWGFLLNLQSISEAYFGKLHPRWQELLLQPFFLQIFNRFAEYMEELSGQNQDGYVPREIPSTECDQIIPQEYLNLSRPLFLHQMQEVGWMYSFEKYPAVSIPKKQQALQFLDTGFYLDPKKKNKLVTIDNERDIFECIMPGGVLASQIGSGKTASIIALTSIGVNHKGDGSKELPLEPVYRPSLIIVTENILQQWQSEFSKFAPQIKVKVIETEKDLKSVVVDKVLGEYHLDYQVILTHRKIIENWGLIEKNCPKLFQVHYKRVIIDEIHEITTLMNEQYGGRQVAISPGAPNTLNFYKGLIRFRRDCTWGVTGTPDNLNYFNEAAPLILLLNLSEGFKQVGSFQKIKEMVVTTCMRKNPRSVHLPKLQKDVQKLHFSNFQNVLYKGKLNYALNNYAAQEICSHLLPQWQHIDAIDHLTKAIRIVQEKQDEEIKSTLNKLKNKTSEEKILQSKLAVLQSEDNFFTEVVKLISQETFECPLCLELLPDKKLVVTDCLHNLCVQCYEGLIAKVHNAQCPVCREEIRNNRLLVHPSFTDETNKLSAIIDAIRQTPKDDKIIIFTQFNNLAEHLSKIFSELGILYTVLRGEPSDINMSLSKFKYLPDLKILLMSIEQSASGINVPEANHIFFAHPIFGMSFEKAALTYNQCIGRAYRIGQKKPVSVKLFVTMNSLEEDLIPTFYKYTNTLN